jgi:peptide/nickel transport system substrate-binding protein
MNRYTPRRRTRRRSLAITVALALISLMLVACGGSSQPAATTGSATSGTPKYGGTLTYDAFSEINSWKVNQLEDQNGGEDRGDFVYDTLLIDTPSGGWTPNIATSMTTSNNVTWTMKLHPNVKFTDGTPLNAAAVVWNVKFLLNPANTFGDLGEISVIKSVTAVNATTVQFVLSRASGSLPLVFGSMPGMMMSPTAYQKNPAAFGNDPVGAGPFMVKSFVRNSETILVRNPHYWDSPKPYLNQVDIKIVTDPTVRAEDLESGQADLAANQSQVQAIVRNNPSLTIFTKVDDGAEAFVPNQNIAPFNDLQIREAMTIGWNYATVNSYLEQGAWPQESFDCPPFSTAQPECAAGVWPKTSIAKAKQLVQQYVSAGHKLGTYTLLTNTSRVPEAQLIQQEMSAIGINLKIESVPNAEFVTLLNKGSFQVAYNGVTPFIGVPWNFLRNIDCQQRHAQQGPCDSQLETAILQAEYGVTAAQRTAAEKTIQQINATDFDYDWFAPSPGGLAGQKFVELGPRYPGASTMVAQDIWLNK